VVSGLGAAGADANALDLSGLFANYAAAQGHMTASGHNTILADAHGDTITILGLNPAALTAARLGF
jgi:hypothetical protein